MNSMVMMAVIKCMASLAPLNRFTEAKRLDFPGLFSVSSLDEGVDQKRAAQQDGNADQHRKKKRHIESPFVKIER